MPHALKRVILVIVVAAGLWLVWKLFFHADDEQRIRRQFDRMASIASKEPNEQPAVSFGKARSLSELFTKDAEAADSRTGGVARGRDTIAQAIAWARESLPEASVEVETVSVQVLDGGKASAVVRLTVDVPGDQPSEFDGEATVTLEKDGGDWLVSSAFLDRGGGQPSQE